MANSEMRTGNAESFLQECILQSGCSWDPAASSTLLNRVLFAIAFIHLPSDQRGRGIAVYHLLARAHLLNTSRVADDCNNLCGQRPKANTMASRSSVIRWNGSRDVAR